MRVEIVVFPGFDELDALGPLEVLRNAAAAGADLDVALVSLTGRAVTGSHGVTLSVDAPLGDVADVIIVPGGGWNDRSPVGARGEAEIGSIPRALTAAHQRGATVAGVCTGTMLMATAGLTRGRPAVTHHGAAGDLRASGAVVIEARVVDDGDIVTAGGVTSGLDLGLWLLERWYGAALADGVATLMEYERRAPVWLHGRDPHPPA